MENEEPKLPAVRSIAWLDRFVTDVDGHEIQAAIRAVVGETDVAVIWCIRRVNALVTTRAMKSIGVEHDVNKQDQDKRQHHDLLPRRRHAVVKPSSDSERHACRNEDAKDSDLPTSKCIVCAHDLTRPKISHDSGGRALLHAEDTS